MEISKIYLVESISGNFDRTKVSYCLEPQLSGQRLAFKVNNGGNITHLHSKIPHKTRFIPSSLKECGLMFVDAPQAELNYNQNKGDKIHLYISDNYVIDLLKSKKRTKDMLHYRNVETVIKLIGSSGDFDSMLCISVEVEATMEVFLDYVERKYFEGGSTIYSKNDLEAAYKKFKAFSKELKEEKFSISSNLGFYSMYFIYEDALTKAFSFDRADSDYFRNLTPYMKKAFAKADKKEK